MSIFEIVENESAEQAALDVFNDVDEKFGTIPVFYRLLATAPPLLETYWLNYNKIILEGALPSVVKELIFLAVARKRKCIYCSSAHLAICDIFEVSRPTLEAIMDESNNFTPTRTAKLVSFCLDSIDSQGVIRESQYQDLSDAGINKVEVIEALYTTSFASSGVYMAKAMKVDVDQDVTKYLDDNKLSIGFI